MSPVKSSYVQCPFRRRDGNSASIWGNGIGTSRGLVGQPSDYAAVLDGTKGSALNGNGIIVFPVRGATATQPPQSAVTFSSVVDGLSYTAVIGEKQLPRAFLNASGDEPHQIVHPGYAWTQGRLLGLCYPLAPSADAAGPNWYWTFGCWHDKGSVPFAMGDGSVRQVKLTADPRALGFLAGRDDRTSYTLP
jgi:hypothetical protein